MNKLKVENGEVIEKALENIKKRNITFAIDASHMYIIEDELTNALNQQRINLIKEILESKEVNALGLELPFPVWQSFKEFLTKLEK